VVPGAVMRWVLIHMMDCPGERTACSSSGDPQY
jgi:hypothetical protein